MDVLTPEMLKSIDESKNYLMTGGLGEVYGMARMSLQSGFPKVQMDPEMALALCELALQPTEAGTPEDRDD